MTLSLAGGEGDEGAYPKSKPTFLESKSEAKTQDTSEDLETFFGVGEGNA